MFKVGKKYEFHMIISGDETTFWGTIETYEHPLIKLKDLTQADMPTIEIVEAETGKPISKVEPKLPSGVVRGEIINVTSPNFISAVEKP